VKPASKKHKATDLHEAYTDHLIKSFAGSRGGFSKEPLAAGGSMLLHLLGIWCPGKNSGILVYRLNRLFPPLTYDKMSG